MNYFRVCFVLALVLAFGCGDDDIADASQDMTPDKSVGEQPCSQQTVGEPCSGSCLPGVCASQCSCNDLLCSEGIWTVPTRPAFCAPECTAQEAGLPCVEGCNPEQCDPSTCGCRQWVCGSDGLWEEPVTPCFECGQASLCMKAESFCAHQVSDTNMPDDYECRPLPAGCEDDPTCACVEPLSPGAFSCDDSNGGPVITYPGG